MPRTSVAFQLNAMLRIHREIAAGRLPNATTLGRILGVAPKTARKYLHRLPTVFGVRPVYDDARHGYYYREETAADVVPRLSEEEVVAVFLLEEARQVLRHTPAGDLVDRVLNKLSLLLPQQTDLTVGQLERAFSLRLERGPVASPGDMRVLRTVHRALLERRRLWILYQSPWPRRRTEREIDPLHLTRCEGQWYLVAYCHLRRDIRTFVPARILKTRLLRTRFLPPPNFDARAHFRTAFGIVADRRVSRVVLRFDAYAAPRVAERRWHPTQKSEKLTDGGLRLVLTCSQSEELLSWLLSWGAHVEVERPPGLARRLRAAHREAAGPEGGVWRTGEA